MPFPRIAWPQRDHGLHGDFLSLDTIGCHRIIFLLHPRRKEFFNKRTEFFSPLSNQENFHFIMQGMGDVGRDLIILWTTAFPSWSPRAFPFFRVWHGSLRLRALSDGTLPALALKNGIKFAGRFCR
jgi:hypothetical protein